MTTIEKKIRITTIQEDVEHLDSKIAVLQEEDIHGQDRYRLERASWFLEQAALQLQQISLMQRPEDVLHILEVSIDGVRGRRRCEVVAENNAG
jgi:hypothetical protein